VIARAGRGARHPFGRRPDHLFGTAGRGEGSDGTLVGRGRRTDESLTGTVVATVRASRMLWAEGMRVAVSTCRFGCMFLVRGPEPRDLRFGEFLWIRGQRAQVGAVQSHLARRRDRLFDHAGDALPLDIGDKGPLVERPPLSLGRQRCHEVVANCTIMYGDSRRRDTCANKHDREER
jgi:hypothetical protein